MFCLIDCVLHMGRIKIEGVEGVVPVHRCTLGPEHLFGVGGWVCMCDWWTGGVSLETPSLIKSSREETTHMYLWTPHQTGMYNSWKGKIYPLQLHREMQHSGLEEAWMNPAVFPLCNRPPGLLLPQPWPQAPMPWLLWGSWARTGSWKRGTPVLIRIVNWA